jgi:RHS repeat-associated protein
MEDPLGNVTRYEYDGNGRLSKVTDANDNETVYEYIGSQRWPSLITDAAGREWGYTFDALGRLIRKTDPLGNAAKYYYDGAGNRTREVDAEGREHTAAYDARNRPIAAGFPDGTTESYTYDGILLMAEGNSETRNVYEYDAAGRRTKVTTYPLGRTISYTYTPSGRIQTETVAGVGTTTYHYDAVGNVAAIDYPGEGTVRYEYDEADRRTRILYPNGAYAVYTYDLAGRIASLIHYDPDSVPLTGQTLAYDKAGNVQEIRDHTGKRKKFSYDPLYRLTEVREDDVKVEGFAYDAVGNISNHYLDGVETAYQYDNADRLIQESRPGETVDYTYDKVGNLIRRTASDGTTAYQYDGKNRLEEVDPPAGDAVSYTYDTDGNTIARTEGSKRTDYLLDGNSVHSDYSGGNLESFYLRGADLDELHGVSQPGKKATYLHQDRLNTVMAGSGEFGQISGQRQYGAYGSMSASTGLSTRYGYTGRELDESTGLMNFRSRWYSPDMGRFISPDRASGDLSVPLSLNRYAYANGNPILNNDPLGYGMFSDAVGIGYNMVVSIASNLLSCFSPIAAAVLGFYDVYFAMINSLMDLLFDYDSIAGSNCALGLLPLMFMLAGFMVVLAAATWTSCANELWKTFVTSLIAEAATNIGEYIAKKLGGAAGLGIYGIIVRILLAYGKALEGFGIGVSVFKFFMAPELLIGFCVLVGLR